MSCQHARSRKSTTCDLVVLKDARIHGKLLDGQGKPFSGPQGPRGPAGPAGGGTGTTLAFGGFFSTADAPSAGAGRSLLPGYSSDADYLFIAGPPNASNLNVNSFARVLLKGGTLTDIEWVSTVRDNAASEFVPYPITLIVTVDGVPVFSQAVSSAAGTLTPAVISGLNIPIGAGALVSVQQTNEAGNLPFALVTAVLHFSS